MKNAVLVLGFLFLGLIVAPVNRAFAYDFGDYRSETLVGKAWKSLVDSDLDAVLAYTNKCIELYADQAKVMQDSLHAYAEGSNTEIFVYWALNDVATSYFIQGDAYRKANMMAEAKTAYEKLVSDYAYGQAWDTKGWFWKPAEAAKEKLAMIESGSDLDFGDYSSSALVSKAWKALGDKDLDDVLAYVNKVIELYADQAKTMQGSLTEYPWESKEKIFSYWALNDVGTAFYVKGEALKNSGQMEEASEAYRQLVEDYFYAQCWDPQGWFWKPSEAAQKRLDDFSESSKEVKVKESKS